MVQYLYGPCQSTAMVRRKRRHMGGSGLNHQMHHFLPCRTTTAPPDLTNLFLHHVWKLHSLPKDIISDPGPQFASELWRQLCSCLRISPRLSAAFHPETDGQTERANQTMEEYLSAFVSHQQDNWS